MTNDKELVEVWKSEFESISELESFNFSKDDFGRYTSSLTDGRWQGFLLAKRTQPSVVLPHPIRINDASVSSKQRITHNDLLVKVVERLTAAGIKYTIGE